VRRGELWTLAGGSDFAGRPRPSVIVQSDLFGTLESVTVCFITSTRSEALQSRPRFEPTAANGLKSVSYVMTDKVSTVRKDRLGKRIGTFSDDDMTEVEAALLVFLGIKSDASLSTR